MCVCALGWVCVCVCVREREKVKGWGVEGGNGYMEEKVCSLNLERACAFTVAPFILLWCGEAHVSLPHHRLCPSTLVWCWIGFFTLSYKGPLESHDAALPGGKEGA